MSNYNKLDKSEQFIFDWQYRMLGGFKTSLIDTIARADKHNLSLLRLGFPDEVDGYLNFTRVDDWWQDVKIKAGR